MFVWNVPEYHKSSCGDCLDPFRDDVCSSEAQLSGSQPRPSNVAFLAGRRLSNKQRGRYRVGLTSNIPVAGGEPRISRTAAA
jgi:hypothetical protein